MGGWGSGEGQGVVGQGLFALSRALNPTGTTEHPLEAGTSSGSGSSTRTVVFVGFILDGYGCLLSVGFILKELLPVFLCLRGQNWLNSFLTNQSKAELENKVI